MDRQNNRTIYFSKGEIQNGNHFNNCIFCRGYHSFTAINHSINQEHDENIDSHLTD